MALLTTGTFVLGFLLTLIVVDVSKLLCGRPRPTFIEACRPDWSLCDVDAGKLQQSSIDVCQQTDRHELVRVQWVNFVLFDAVVTWKAVVGLQWTRHTVNSSHVTSSLFHQKVNSSQWTRHKDCHTVQWTRHTVITKQWTRHSELVTG